MTATAPLLGLEHLILPINLIQFLDHLVELFEVLTVIILPILVGFDLAHLQYSLCEIFIRGGLLLSAKILDKTYGLIFRIFRVLFFSPWNLLILLRQRLMVE